MKLAQELNMIGIDVAKNKLDIALDDARTITVSNDEKGFNALLKAVENPCQTCFVMEATGGYEQPLAHFLLAKNLSVSVVNPKRVRDYANAMGAYAKNDRIDAQMIRHYSQSAHAKNRLTLRKPSTRTAQKLEALLRRRNQLVDQRAAEKQHLEAAYDKSAVCCMDAGGRAMQEQLPNRRRKVSSTAASRTWWILIWRNSLIESIMTG
ncbi:MAG: transposase [Methylomonas lenta]|nr:transposase [Methylomonas lenta]